MAQASVDELSARFAANANDRLAFEALEEAHFVAGRWPALVELYEQRLAATELAGPKLAAPRARLLLRLAQVLEERCDRVDDAVARYQEAVRADPGYRFFTCSNRYRKRLLESRVMPPVAIRRWASFAILPPLTKSYLEINKALGRLGSHPTPNATPNERAESLTQVLPPATTPARYVHASA